MIYARPGDPIEAILEGAATGLVGVLAFEIVDPPTGSAIVARTTAGIVETVPGAGVYARVQPAPPSDGRYLVVWDTAPSAAERTAANTWTEQLEVNGAGAPAAPPANLDLTTIAKVRAALNERDEDDEQDDVIADLITDASALIELHAHREFAPRLAPEVRTFRYVGDGLIDLKPFDLRFLASVTDYAGSDRAAAFAEPDYELRAAAPLYTTSRWLALPRAGSAARQVEITGLWGMERVPYVAARACIITVVTWLRRDVSAFSRTYLLEEGRTERPDALPAAAIAMLKPFRRRT